MTHYNNSRDLITLNAAPASEAQTHRPARWFANTMESLCRLVWTGLYQYARLTTVYDEYGYAHSTHMWF